MRKCKIGFQRKRVVHNQVSGLKIHKLKLKAFRKNVRIHRSMKENSWKTVNGSEQKKNSTQNIDKLRIDHWNYNLQLTICFFFVYLRPVFYVGSEAHGFFFSFNNVWHVLESCFVLVSKCLDECYVGIFYWYAIMIQSCKLCSWFVYFWILVHLCCFLFFFSVCFHSWFAMLKHITSTRMNYIRFDIIFLFRFVLFCFSFNWNYITTFIYRQNIEYEKVYH